MTRIKLILFLVVAALAPATALAASGAAPTLPGRWTKLPTAPISPDWGSAASVWTGKQLLVFGRDQRTAKAANGSLYSIGSVNVAASYDPGPAAGASCRRPPARPTPRASRPPGRARDARLGQLRLPGLQPGDEPLAAPAAGAHHARRRRWTGRELIGWGGGCCGDAFTDGSAYNPGTNRWRRCPARRSPAASTRSWPGRATR